MSIAGQAARGAAVQLPLGQLAAVGLGLFALTNPEKFLESLAKTIHMLQTPSSHNGQTASVAPIVIHHTSPTHYGAPGGGSVGVYMVKLALCTGAVGWGTYMIFYQILPETAKGMLPVSTNTFNKAVTSLGKAVVNLKDTSIAQFRSLWQKMEGLGAQQQETHTEVLDIKDNVKVVRSDLTLVQEALTLCHQSLSESERRTSYIARGVQLLTRGVSTILHDDESLLNELVSFNNAGEGIFNAQGPVQQHQLQRTLRAMHQHQRLQVTSPQMVVPQTPIAAAVLDKGADPENEVPAYSLEDVDSTVMALIGGLGILGQGQKCQ